MEKPAQLEFEPSERSTGCQKSNEAFKATMKHKKGGDTMKKKQIKIRKLSDNLFNGKCQLAVMRVVYERVQELRKDIKDGINPENAELEIEELRAYCSNGFRLSYLTVYEMSGESVSVQEAMGPLYDIWLELWENVCADYQPYIVDS